MFYLVVYVVSLCVNSHLMAYHLFVFIV